MHAIEYYSAIKRNEEPIPATTQMKQERVMLSKGCQTLKDTYFMVPLIGNIHNRQIYRDGK